MNFNYYTGDISFSFRKETYYYLPSSVYDQSKISTPLTSNMSAPSSDRGIQQTALDSNQHGQAQNIIDETKSNYGGKVDANVGETIDAGKQGGLSKRVEKLTNQPTDDLPTIGTQNKIAQRDEFQVGSGEDAHDTAARNQP
ncbi:hypothetical protein jhhlp_000691 [Lomentospora prolificans]|uniref:Uncharacterized protein n=1 Tax=Lomentospora prolificans TaxID=41688 RepID=A0A2N3NJ63_9PEZI|nr:hypothetical protein jhhlp_000691 [Lomentospora prolificans]